MSSGIIFLLTVSVLPPNRFYRYSHGNTREWEQLSILAQYVGKYLQVWLVSLAW